MKKNSQQRKRVRDPVLVEAFSSRFRQVIAHAGIQQGDLAGKLGGFRQETISRLSRGAATSLPIDLLVRIAEWADASGISVKWLVLGMGPMKKEELPKDSRVGERINQVMAYTMICVLAKRLGLNLDGVLPGWMIWEDLPGGGVRSYDLNKLIKTIEQQGRKKRRKK